MANTNLIYTYIQDSGYKLQYVASVLHISSNTLRHKLLGETQFKLDEAERLSTMLGLTMAERVAKSKAKAFFIDRFCHPQTIAVIRTRAQPPPSHGLCSAASAVSPAKGRPAAKTRAR